MGQKSVTILSLQGPSSAFEGDEILIGFYAEINETTGISINASFYDKDMGNMIYDHNGQPVTWGNVPLLPGYHLHLARYVIMPNKNWNLQLRISHIEGPDEFIDAVGDMTIGLAGSLPPQPPPQEGVAQIMGVTVPTEAQQNDWVYIIPKIQNTGVSDTMFVRVYTTPNVNNGYASKDLATGETWAPVWSFQMPNQDLQFRVVAGHLIESMGNPEVIDDQRTYTTVLVGPPAPLEGFGEVNKVYVNNYETTLVQPQANPGDPLNLKLQLFNRGGQDLIFCSIMDKDTGALITDVNGNLFYSKFDMLGNSGQQVYGDFQMPSKTWNLVAQSGHDTNGMDAIDTVFPFTINLIQPEPPPEEPPTTPPEEPPPEEPPIEPPPEEPPAEPPAEPPSDQPAQPKAGIALGIGIGAVVAAASLIKKKR